MASAFGVRACSHPASMSQGPETCASRPCNTERAGFDQARMVKLFQKLYLRQKARDFKDLNSLERFLFSHGFLLSCDLI